MRRVLFFCFALITLPLALHLLLSAIAPLVPFAIGGLVAVGLLRLVYYRRRRW